MFSTKALHYVKKIFILVFYIILRIFPLFFRYTFILYDIIIIQIKWKSCFLLPIIKNIKVLCYLAFNLKKCRSFYLCRTERSEFGWTRGPPRGSSPADSGSRARRKLGISRTPKSCTPGSGPLYRVGSASGFKISNQTVSI